MPDIIKAPTVKLGARHGLKGISNTSPVISIVGQFLEHGGDDEYFIGSVDLMAHNLERRVGIRTPITNSHARSEIDWLLEQQIEGPRNGWDMLPDGNYKQRQTKGAMQKEGSEELVI